MKRYTLLLVAMLACAIPFATAKTHAAEPDEDGFISIFDGECFVASGWKANENQTWKVEDGEIRGFGERSHLYFMTELRNFELKIDCWINDNGNSGIFVKAPWIEYGWPTDGFEAQINATHEDWIKTGSIWGIVHLHEAPHEIDEWFTYHIIVRDHTMTLKVNGKTLFTYEDPAGRRGPATGANGQPLRWIGQPGYIALQQHDPGSLPRFKNIRLKKLP